MKILLLVSLIILFLYILPRYKKPRVIKGFIQKEQSIEIKDWRTNGDYILLVLQRPGDSSLKKLIDNHGSYKQFIEYTITQIKKYTDRPIRVRMHPLRQDRQLEAPPRLLCRRYK